MGHTQSLEEIQAFYSGKQLIRESRSNFQCLVEITLMGGTTDDNAHPFIPYDILSGQSPSEVNERRRDVTQPNFTSGAFFGLGGFRSDRFLAFYDVLPANETTGLITFPRLVSARSSPGEMYIPHSDLPNYIFNKEKLLYLLNKPEYNLPLAAKAVDKMNWPW